jgi:hypothetical protein
LMWIFVWPESTLIVQFRRPSRRRLVKSWSKKVVAGSKQAKMWREDQSSDVETFSFSILQVIFSTHKTLIEGDDRSIRNSVCSAVWQFWHRPVHWICSFVFKLFSSLKVTQ